MPFPPTHTHTPTHTHSAIYCTNHGMLADLEVQKTTQNITDRIPVINIVKIEESREIGTARERKFA